MTAKYDLTVQVDLRPQEWMRQAACKGHPNPDLWFPDVGDMGFQAKRICADCPVREECAEFGKSEQYGIWGGLGYKSRQPQRRGPRIREVKGPMCGYGHMMTAENTVIMSEGKRFCRECRRQARAKPRELRPR